MSRPDRRSRKAAPIHSWLIEPLAPDVRRAVERLSRADDIVHIALMPDVHLAEGVCVGTVAATTHLIYPQAVGGDIGCGMAAIAFDCEADRLKDARVATRLLDRLAEAIPVLLHNSLSAAPALPGTIEPADGRGVLVSSAKLERDARREGRIQFGTLGRGNHFLEFQAAEDGRLWLMVHTGSRHMGQAITAHHLAIATKTAGGLFHLDADTEAGRRYLADLEWACRYADANRREIIARAIAVAGELLGCPPVPDSLITCNHNHVRRESHFGRELWVHRKGAVPAADGEPGIVPGSMGTSSVHTLGRGEPLALNSCAHGAGRRLSRDAARRTVSPRRLASEIDGVWFNPRIAAQLCEEAPSAYKDIDAVLRAQRPLARIVRRLRPVLVYKGV